MFTWPKNFVFGQVLFSSACMCLCVCVCMCVSVCVCVCVSFMYIWMYTCVCTKMLKSTKPHLENRFTGIKNFWSIHPNHIFTQLRFLLIIPTAYRYPKGYGMLLTPRNKALCGSVSFSHFRLSDMLTHRVHEVSANSKYIQHLKIDLYTQHRHKFR